MSKYRYVEQEKFCGTRHMMRGVTRYSLAAMKHLPKIGTPSRVRGYLYKSGDIVFPAVKVYGDKGTIRFSGFSWGYCGEGPRGLQTLFDTLGIQRDATTIGNWDWDNRSDTGTQWEITLKS